MIPYPGRIEKLQRMIDTLGAQEIAAEGIMEKIILSNIRVGLETELDIMTGKSYG